MHHPSSWLGQAARASRRARLGVAARRAAFWVAVFAFAAVAGCGGAAERKLKPLEGYRQVSPDAPPFDEASAGCQREAAFRTGDGTAFTDWRQFERCMQQRGWTREPAAVEPPTPNEPEVPATPPS